MESKPATKMLLPIETVKSEVERLCRIIDNSQSRCGFVTFDAPLPYAIPYITLDDKGYHFIVYDRGFKIRDDVTTDYQELLYWIFKSITFEMAHDYFLLHPIPGIKPRRIMFVKQLKLLSMIRPDFAARAKRDLEAILEKHPFTDGYPNIPDWDLSQVTPQPPLQHPWPPIGLFDKDGNIVNDCPSAVPVQGMTDEPKLKVECPCQGSLNEPGEACTGTENGKNGQKYEQ